MGQLLSNAIGITSHPSLVDCLNVENCYYFNNETKTHEKINALPVKPDILKHVTFKNPKNNKYYVLIVEETKETCHIFDCKMKKFMAIKYENFESLYQEFGSYFAIINDIFNSNIIHIAGGDRQPNKYGYLQCQSHFNAAS